MQSDHFAALVGLIGPPCESLESLRDTMVCPCFNPFCRGANESDMSPKAVAMCHRKDTAASAGCLSEGISHHWHYQPRLNAATKTFPTDFLTVNFANPLVSVPYLLAIAGIKSISEEKQHRSLLWSRVTRELNEDRQNQECNDRNNGMGCSDDGSVVCPPSRCDHHGVPHFWKFRAPPFPFNPEPLPLKRIVYLSIQWNAFAVVF